MPHLHLYPSVCFFVYCVNVNILCIKTVILLAYIAPLNTVIGVRTCCVTHRIFNTNPSYRQYYCAFLVLKFADKKSIFIGRL